MCLKWDFSGIEGNYATICKQLQIRIISENIFSLILIVYRHRKLGSPSVADGQARLHATTGRVSVPESGRIFSGCTFLTCSFWVDMPQCARSGTGNKDVFG